MFEASEQPKLPAEKCEAPVCRLFLLVIEDASAHFGGDGFLPLQYSRLLGKHGVDAHLLVHARGRSELESLFPDERDRTHYIPDTRAARLRRKLGTAPLETHPPPSSWPA